MNLGTNPGGGTLGGATATARSRRRELRQPARRLSESRYTRPPPLPGLVARPAERSRSRAGWDDRGHGEARRRWPADRRRHRRGRSRAESSRRTDVTGADGSFALPGLRRDVRRTGPPPTATRRHPDRRVGRGRRDGGATIGLAAGPAPGAISCLTIGSGLSAVVEAGAGRGLSLHDAVGQSPRHRSGQLERRRYRRLLSGRRTGRHGGQDPRHRLARLRARAPSRSTAWPPSSPRARRPRSLTSVPAGATTGPIGVTVGSASKPRAPARYRRVVGTAAPSDQRLHTRGHASKGGSVTVSGSTRPDPARTTAQKLNVTLVPVTSASEQPGDRGADPRSRRAAYR